MVQIPSWAVGAILGPLLATLLAVTALLARSLEQLKTIAERLKTLEERSEAQAEQHKQFALLKQDHDTLKQKVFEIAGSVKLQGDEQDELERRVDRLAQARPRRGTGAVDRDRDGE